MEIDISIGLSNFNIVGLPEGTIKESRNQVTEAATNSRFKFPVRRLVVNLTLVSLRKIGPRFDLQIVATMLGELRYFPVETLEKVMLVGELFLDGAI